MFNVIAGDLITSVRIAAGSVNTCRYVKKYFEDIFEYICRFIYLIVNSILPTLTIYCGQ